MKFTHRVGFFGKMATLWVAMVFAILCPLLGALLLFTAAFVIWLDHYVGPAASAALAGVALVLVAIIIFAGFKAALRRMQTKQPSLFGDMFGLPMLALRLVFMTIRKSPRKALLAAAIFGALTDYFTSDRATKR